MGTLNSIQQVRGKTLRAVIVTAFCQCAIFTSPEPPQRREASLLARFNLWSDQPNMVYTHCVSDVDHIGNR